LVGSCSSWETPEQAAAVVGARGTDMVQALAAADYGQELHHDRFCRRCSRAFCSQFCPEHAALHHPAGGQNEIVEVVHFDGWAAVEPSILVPPQVLVGVQVNQSSLQLLCLLCS